MKRSMKTVKILGGLLLGAAIFSFVVIAGTGRERPYDQYNNGLHVEGAAGGTKLSGSIGVEQYNIVEKYSNCPAVGFPDAAIADARVVLRLNTTDGKNPKVLYAELEGIDYKADFGEKQDLITDAMKCDILKTFSFIPGNTDCEAPELDSWTIYLKDARDISESTANTSLTGDWGSCVATDQELPDYCHVQICGGSYLTSMSVVLAVN